MEFKRDKKEKYFLILLDFLKYFYYNFGIKKEKRKTPC